VLPIQTRVDENGLYVLVREKAIGVLVLAQSRQANGIH
jgi:hypothetical protein